MSELKPLTTQQLTVKWHGKTFKFDADSNEWDGQIAKALENNRGIAAVELILGPEQTEIVWKLKPKKKDLSELYDLIFDAVKIHNKGE